MKKIKLSKQTLFTLLGILVIVSSIPITVLLVKQRQEIRKEAAQSCGSWCASKVGHADFPWCICNRDRAPRSDFERVASTNTSDPCNPCEAYRQKSSSQPTPTPISNKTSCGSWCASKVGHADFPWCICNADRSPQSGYTETARTTTDDCTRSCVAYSSTGGTSSSETSCGSWCASKVGHTDFPWCICDADRSPQSGYTETARTTTDDCTRSCVAYSSTDGTAQGSGRYPVWGLYQTGRTCSIKTPTPTPTSTLTPTPTPTGTVTPTPTPTSTLTPTPTPTGTVTPTPTPTSTLTPTPTPTGTVTPTPTPTPTTTTAIAEATPSAELPEAGFTLPTFGAIIGGILLIVVSLVFIL